MKAKSNRLYFVDAIRAWAILMMLQGHFVDGLLDPIFRDSSHTGYKIWLYFRGITAPVFFTVSGFIFTYLLIKVPEKGLKNPRVKKGIKRGLQLLLIGYVLRMNLFGLLSGHIYESFYIVDVLHCIGLSILGIVGIYVLTAKQKAVVFPSFLVLITVILFFFEPQYANLAHTYLPKGIANYFTKINGSVFTIFPWFGYATFGSFLALLFSKYKNVAFLYPKAISISLISGFLLIFYSSAVLLKIGDISGISLFTDVYYNNYLFIRLGDVLVVFAVFMLLRRFMIRPTLLKIGQSTLSIYVIHFIILYGSLTGIGLYQYLHHSLSPAIVIVGALLFMIVCTFLSLQYEKKKEGIHLSIATFFRYLRVQLESIRPVVLRFFKIAYHKVKLLLLRLFRLAKN
ncbi:heparan-alpha-glucosaminide N-acetyltransferase domain-containing protein [Spongiimicrobium salis]|uniref:heparan-alpha-glucosaminide N-acetyltransferase domain-containing protein n=1 Tax=Spongiimicrobium salis TaxID=1667022 RepID=UPI00374CD222